MNERFMIRNLRILRERDCLGTQSASKLGDWNPRSALLGA